VKGGGLMKDATVSARVEYDVKKEAEDILRNLGVPVSVVINSLYRQIIERNGIPFSLTLPKVPRTLDTMSDEELNIHLRQGYEEALAGRGIPCDEFFESLKKRYIS
jgi:addiction module antitoxin, relB/dinJ family